MPQSPTHTIKNQNKTSKSKLTITKITNGVSNIQQTTIKNNSTSAASSSVINIMDTSNNDNSLLDGWTISSTNKSKRNHSSSSEQNSPLTPKNKTIKLFFCTNRYEVLTQEDPALETSLNDNIDPIQNPKVSINVEPKALRPPPIFVRGICNFPDLCTKLIELIGVDNFYCKSSPDRLKIMTKNPESYRTLVHFLREQKAEFHTFQLKEDKQIRVVIRNLHPTTPTELIKTELETRLFEVRQVSSVLHKINKHPLPLFFVDLEPTEQSNDIYSLTSLLHT